MMIRNKEQGFIITTTMVLVFTVVFIGLLVGVSAVRNAWFKKASFENSIDVYVLTSDNRVLGKAVDFDEHEAPLVPFVDYEVPAGSDDNYRVLVGVRDDRFTSRERVYYPDTNALNCTGTPCVFVPSSETSGPSSINSQGVDELPGTGGVSYQLATQAGGGAGSEYTYAVGSTDGALPGRLYRQNSDVECAVTIDPSVDTYISYWQSQRVVAEEGTDSGPGTNPPCYQEIFAKAAVTEDLFLRCQNAYPSSNCCTSVGQIVNNHSCGTPLCVNDAGQCECPPGFSKLGNSSGWCCPDGSSDLSNGQCQQIAVTYVPSEGDFLEAISVDHPNGGNVLDGLGVSFKVNLPINPDDFQTNPAVGVE